jgi:hypothetical protein
VVSWSRINRSFHSGIFVSSFWLQYGASGGSLHDEPEYQAMVAEIEAGMAAQLARVHEMDRNGELETIPGALQHLADEAAHHFSKISISDLFLNSAICAASFFFDSSPWR